MSQSAVRSPKHTTRAWRMRAWPGDDSVAHLIFVDHHDVPTTPDVAAAVEHAARKGARAVRTSALFPDSARVVLASGFTTIDRLALLEFELDRFDPDHADGDPSDGDPPQGTRHRVTPMRSWHLTPCSRIDRESFGLMWGNTAASLRDIRRATPAHHCRIVRQHRDLAGFAISGAAADTGYIQRLAVTSEQRRAGVGRTLIIDAVTWMHRRGARRALVNTGIENEPALALYDTIGFTRRDDELVIAEFTLS